MGKRRVLMVLIWMTVSLELCSCSVENDGNEKSESWTDNGKLATELGQSKSDDEKETLDHDHVSVVSTETIDSAVSDTSQSVSSKSSKVVPEAKELNMQDETMRRVALAKNECSSNTTVGFDPLEMVGPGLECGRNRTVVKGVSRKRGNHTHHHHHHHHRRRIRGEVRSRKRIGSEDNGIRIDKAPAPKSVNDNYNQAHRKLQESHELAEEMTTTEKAKIVYEAAKENLSQVTGDLGATMRERGEEL